MESLEFYSDSSVSYMLCYVKRSDWKVHKCPEMFMSVLKHVARASCKTMKLDYREKFLKFKLEKYTIWTRNDYVTLIWFISYINLFVYILIFWIKSNLCLSDASIFDWISSEARLSNFTCQNKMYDKRTLFRVTRINIFFKCAKLFPRNKELKSNFSTETSHWNVLNFLIGNSARLFRNQPVIM